MENEARITKANEIKSLIDTLKPVTDWGFTCNVWTRPDANGGGQVRVYVNDKNRKPAAILILDQNGNVTPEWQSGHSLTRAEIRAALGL